MNYTEALEYMDTAYKKYDAYSEVEKPRISKKEVKIRPINIAFKEIDKNFQN